MSTLPFNVRAANGATRDPFEDREDSDDGEESEEHTRDEVKENLCAYTKMLESSIYQRTKHTAKENERQGLFTLSTINHSDD